MNTPNDPKGAAGALKTPLGLIPSYAMEQTAWVHKLGSDKYGPFNWRLTGVCASTYVNAILRHLNAWRDGETVDPESGISHLAHVACSCNILLDAGFCGTLQDDRNVTPQNTNNQLHETNKQDQGCDRNDTKYHNRGHDEVDYYESEGGFGFVSTFKIPIEFSDKVEPTPFQYTEYKLLEVAELIQEDDEFFCSKSKKWIPTRWKAKDGYCIGSHSSPYRRKVYASGEPEQPIEAEYRLLKVGEIIQEGDEHYNRVHLKWYLVKNGIGKKVRAHFNDHRRKVGTSNEPAECSCGRYKIRHFTLGLICEDCELQWQDPY